MQNMLHKIDLNLLKVLRVLLDDPHVSRAAEKLGLTQPAVSQALSRLRVHFKDELLVRGGQGFVLTSYAESMKPALAELWSALDKCMSIEPVFDKKTSKRRFVVGMYEPVSMVLAPNIIKRMMQEAPQMKVEIVSLSYNSWQETLSAGEADLVITWKSPDIKPTAEIKQQILYKDPLSCCMAPSHPLAKKKAITKEEYIGAHHMRMLFHNQKGSLFDTMLAKQGYVREKMTTVPFYLQTLDILAESNCIVTVPHSSLLYAKKFMGSKFNFAIKKIPFDAPPIEVMQFWHVRHHDDPAHKWLRNMVYEDAKQIAGAAL
ncbi:MAG: LysR family transcriptional regulator [Alphaproteobacteria bacterium]|nr:LysR family transcriptional regulator [Alphaproteobacteria bacterium]